MTIGMRARAVQMSAVLAVLGVIGMPSALRSQRAHCGPLGTSIEMAPPRGIASGQWSGALGLALGILAGSEYPAYFQPFTHTADSAAVASSAPDNSVCLRATPLLAIRGLRIVRIDADMIDQRRPVPVALKELFVAFTGDGRTVVLPPDREATTLFRNPPDLPRLGALLEAERLATSSGHGPAERLTVARALFGGPPGVRTSVLACGPNLEDVRVATEDGYRSLTTTIRFETSGRIIARSQVDSLLAGC